MDNLINVNDDYTTIDIQILDKIVKLDEDITKQIKDYAIKNNISVDTAVKDALIQVVKKDIDKDTIQLPKEVIDVFIAKLNEYKNNMEDTKR